MTKLTCSAGEREFGQGLPTLLINDQIKIINQEPAVLEQLKLGQTDLLLELAYQGKQLGVEAVDILLDNPEIDETSLLPKLAKEIDEKVGCFISLDTRSPQALEAALKALHPHKVLINSVNTEPETLEQILPLAAEFKAPVVGIPLGGGLGIPNSLEGRLKGAVIILEAARRYGIPEEDLVLDGICMASAVEFDSMRLTLQTLSAFEKELGMTTILGISNAGHGMPTKTVIDLAYLIAAVPWGLHSAIVNPSTLGLMETTLAVDFLVNRDPYGKRYINHYRQKKGMANGVS
jgi:5-methyltetrahydrofolate--homocysteine methyltransferase